MNPADQKSLEVFVHVAMSFLQGVNRLGEARFTGERLLRAYYSANADATLRKDKLCDVKHMLVELPEERVNSFERVRHSSELVYATALFDTFLTDTTMFLLLMHPRAIGKNSSVPLEVLLASSSRSEAITEAARRKARELAHAGFDARMKALEAPFGLHFNIPKDVAHALTHYSGLRNVVVHDQSFYDFALTDTGLIATERSSTWPVRYEDIDTAAAAYRSVAAAVADVVFRDVLKVADHQLAIDAVTALRGSHK